MEVTSVTILKSLILIFSKFVLVTSQNFNYGLCSDAQCSAPIAIGITTLSYNSPESNKLSFLPNQEVTIYVRDYGIKKDLFGVVLNGARGFIPKAMVRETKSLKKATVPANVEFLQPQYTTNTHHTSSHVHVSSQIPRADVHHTVQPSVPNAFNPQFEGQSVQHSGFPLESSPYNRWQREQSHVHPSSDLYIVRNEQSNNYHSQTGNLVHHVPQMESSSHTHFGSENMRGSANIPRFDSMRNHESNVIQSPHFRQSLESQWQNHPSSHFSEETYAQGMLSENVGQNFDPQSNSLFYGQVSQTVTPQANIHNQRPSSHAASHPFHLENDIQEFEKTMAMLKEQGYIPEKDLANQFPSEHLLRQPILSSTQNFHSEHQVKDAITVSQGDSSIYSDPSSMKHSSQGFQHNPSSSYQVNDIQKNLGSEFIKSSSAAHSEYAQPGKPELPKPETKRLNLDKINARIDKIINDVEDINADEDDYEDHENKENAQNVPKASLGTEPKEEKSHIQEINSRQSKIISPQTIDPNSEVYSSRENVQSLVKSDEQNTYTTESRASSSESVQSLVKSDEQNTYTTESRARSSENVQSPLKSDVQNTRTTESRALPSISTTSKDSNVLSHDFNSEAEATQEIKESSERENIEGIKEEIVASESSVIEEKIEPNNLTSDRFEGNKLSQNNILDPFSTDGSSQPSNSANILPTDKELSQETKVDFLTDNDNNDFTFPNSEGNESDIYSVDNSKIDLIQNGSESDFISTDQSSDLDSLPNVSDIKETENLDHLNAYQARHLKDVESNDENFTPSEETEQTVSYSEFNLYTSLENSFEALRSFVEALLPWIPDPLYTIIIDLEKEGISPKVPVFTALSAIPCIILMVLLVYIKEKSKEKKLIAHLTILEKNLYNLTAEKNILEEKLEKAEVELQISRTMLEEEKILSFKLKTEVDCLKQQVEESTLELEKNADAFDTLKEREREYIELVRDHEKEHLNLLEQKNEIENRLLDQEGDISDLQEQLQEKETAIEKLLSEKSEYSQANEIFEEKLSQLQKNCNQLLQEAEVWNMRVKELSEKLNQEVSAKEELENSLKEKTMEIEALTEAIQVFKSFEEIGASDGEEPKSCEEKLKYLINSSNILIKLLKQEEDNKLLSERLLEEKNKLLEMEVSILDVKSENDKLKLNYNQALQDKAEAQTKLDVLTNYFKDKEIQLQKQLGVQEAVRQRTEEGANSAERRICLIEQENASYKYQVATMKQEMEETERNLKGQIAMQEKKAHESWLAARTAERKLEDTKQEVMQLRQRLTLLEREQETWSNSTRDEIIRPVPKRIANASEETMTTQDSNSSLELRSAMFPPPPMMLPPDRPLPPLPPLPPPFLNPFEPPPPFRPQPWHIPPDPNADYRITPPDFGRGRESTPPRGRNSNLIDGDMGPRQSSPITDMRDSRNSTPPHLLPDFHDIPPHPPRPFYPPMGPRTRYPLPPPPNFRREHIPGPKRIDNQDENNSSFRPQHQPVPQDSWPNPNSRV